MFRSDFQLNISKKMSDNKKHLPLQSMIRFFTDFLKKKLACNFWSLRSSGHPSKTSVKE